MRTTVVEFFRIENELFKNKKIILSNSSINAYLPQLQKLNLLETIVI